MIFFSQYVNNICNFEVLCLVKTRKCPLRMVLGAHPGSTLGVNPGGQGVIPRRFKRKKIFVTDVRTNAWTDRHDGRNSGLDV